MVGRVTGGSSAAQAEAARQAAAAAAEARRRAEEARRRAEEARRRAEEARRQAEQARAQAEAQRRQLEQTQRALRDQGANGPQRAQLEQRAANQREAAQNAERAARQAEARQQRAEEQVAITARAAETEMRNANRAAAVDRSPPPYSQNQIQAEQLTTNEVRAAYDGATARRRDDIARQIGVDSTTDIAGIREDLRANREFDRLAARPENAQTLQELDINNGADLQAFGERVNRQADGGEAREDDVDLSAVADREALARIIGGAGQTLEGPANELLTDEKFAQEIAGGGTLRDAAVAARSDDLDPEVREGYERMGIDVNDVAELPNRDRQAMEAAARAANQEGANPADVLNELRGVDSEAGRNLATRAMSGFAEDLDDGAAKSLLQNEGAVRELLANDEAAQAFGQLASGDAAQAPEALATLLGNDTLRDATIDAVVEDPTYGPKLEELGLDAAQLKELGAGAAGVLDAVNELTGEPPNVPGALEHLRGALRDSGSVGDDLLARVGDLPGIRDTPLGTLLKDSDVREQLLNNDAAFESLKKLADPETQTEGLRELVNNAEIRDATLEALGEDPTIERMLGAIGLEGSDLADLGRAAPHVFDALDAFNATPANNEAGFLALRRAFEQGGEPVSNLTDKILESPNVSGMLTRMGLEAEQLSDADEAIPALLGAASHLSADPARTEDALREVSNALEAAPDARDEIAEAVLGSRLVAPKLRELGLQPSDLADLDDGFAPALDAVADLMEGKISEGLANLQRAFEASPEAAENLTQAVLNTDSVKTKLAEWGLEPSDFEGVAGAMPHLLAAASNLTSDNPNIPDALRSLSSAVEEGGRAVDALTNKLLESDRIKTKLAEAGLEPSDLADLDEGLPDVLNAVASFADGDVAGGLRGLQAAFESSPETVQALADKFLNAPAVKAKLEDFGLAPEDFSDIGQALPHILGAAANLVDGNVPGALADLQSAYLAAPTSMRNVTQALLESKLVQDRLGALNINPDDLRDLGAAMPALLGAVSSIEQGNIEDALRGLQSAYLSAPEAMGRFTEAILERPALANKLTALGLSPEEFADAGEAMPNLLQAAADLMSRPPKITDALAALGEVAVDVPALAEKVITTLGARLPDGFLKDMLTDPEIVGALVRDGGTAVAGILSGDAAQVSEGFAALAENEQLMGLVADKLWAKPGLRNTLERFGFRNAGDLAQAAGAFGEVLDLVQNFQDRDFAAMAGNVGAIFSALPTELKNRVGDAITDVLHLPEGVTDILVSAGELLADEEFRNLIGQSFAALPDDPQAFATHLLSAGQHVVNEHPDAAIAFLDAIGEHAPGKIGALFSNRELNEQLVRSGAINNMFEAGKKLVEGDILGALTTLGSSIVDILTAGDDNYRVEAGWGPAKIGADLPFTESGVNAIGQLFEVFKAALPGQVQDMIADGLESILASGSPNPISAVRSAINNGGQFLDDIGEDPPDIIGAVINGGQVILDVAGLLGPVGRTLKTVFGPILAVGEVVNNIHQFSQNVDEFSAEFTGIA